MPSGRIALSLEGLARSGAARTCSQAGVEAIASGLSRFAGRGWQAWHFDLLFLTIPRFFLSRSGITPPLLPTILDALNEREWTYTVNEELSLVTFGVGGEHSAYNCALFADDETRLVTMIAQSPMRVPHEERITACELLMRANHGLMFGAFDIDFSDGEVRYKVAVDVEGGTLGIEAVHSMITVALDMYELWYPPLMKVVYGGVAPEDAVAQVGGGWTGSDDVEDDDAGGDESWGAEEGGEEDDSGDDVGDRDPDAGDHR